MKFVDEVKIKVQSGNGGRGCVSFRREKYVPHGGPDGGDGGRGGNVLLQATENKHTLLDFRFRNLFKAEAGRHGMGKNRHGRSGEDLLLEVPVGTVVKDPEDGHILVDLDGSGKEWVAANGGQGGRGNAHFVSSTRQVPRFAQDGQEGEQREIVLELKLMADVGLVGLPNAGKSTLIASVSAATPKIADYPFTTLVPVLGVVALDDGRPFVMADIPGLIEGAHLGVGLGIRFLRHVERTRVLAHVIDISSVSLQDPLLPYRQIEQELTSYSEGMARKRRIVVLNKIDLAPDAEFLETVESKYRETGHPVFCVSAARRQGTRDVVAHLTRLLSKTD